MPSKRHSVDRRSVVKAAGGVAAGGLLAGCSGDGGDGTTTDGMETTSPQSYEAAQGQIGFELVSMPVTVALREMLPASTNDRFTGVIQNMSSGTLQMPAMLSGQTQFALTSPGTVYQAAVAGADVRMVATAVAGTDYVIATSADVDSLEDFVNEDLAMAANVGTLSGNQVMGVFAQEGLDADQINFISVGGSSDRTQALAAGQAQGAAIHFGQARGLQEQGLDINILVEVAEYYPSFIQNTIAAYGPFLDSDVGDEYTQAYVNEIYRANQRANEDFDWIYNATQRYTAQPLQRENAMDAWELNKEYNAWKTSPMATSGYDGVLQMLSAADQINADEVNLDDLLVTEYSDNAIDELD